MSSPVRAGRANTVGCVESAALFQDTLLETPPKRSSRGQDRRRSATLLNQTEAVCRTCPLVVDCLYQAVACHDVAGFAGGTTQVQRQHIRDELGITVAPEDLDSLAGVTAPYRQVDHAEVLRLRRAHPQETLDSLARRLGCSLSTVKRHLRQERQAGPPKKDIPRPGPDEVWSAHVRLFRSESSQQDQIAA